MEEPEAHQNSYYDPGVNRAKRVRALFDQIARRYDVINDIQSGGMHRLWKRRLILEAPIIPGSSALDVCCGTGDLSFALAAKGAEVTGLDFSQAMLDQARSRGDARMADTERKKPLFIEGDAMALPFMDDSFDIVTMAYGLRNLSHWQNGLRELHRVTRPGGRILILDFGKPPNQLWRSIYYSYLRLVVPVLGWSLVGDAEAYRYILTSLQHFPAQRGIESEMLKMGCRGLHTHLFMGGVMSLNMGTA
jgi:demethylmenaquinone methyltransferase / 2-methoxy-6-polyprenyl-1,4-benzoquinol methylase